MSIIDEYHRGISNIDTNWGTSIMLIFLSILFYRIFSDSINFAHFNIT